MNIKKLVVVVSLFVGSLVQAGPEFDKALKEATLESKDTYVGRLKLLALWLMNGLNLCMATGYGDVGGFKSARRLQMSDLLIDDTIRELKIPLAVNAIKEINGELENWGLAFGAEDLYPSAYKIATKNFGVYKKYYDQLKKKLTEILGTDTAPKRLVDKNPDIFVLLDLMEKEMTTKMPEYNEFSLFLLQGRERR